MSVQPISPSSSNTQSAGPRCKRGLLQTAATLSCQSSASSVTPRGDVSDRAADRQPLRAALHAHPESAASRRLDRDVALALGGGKLLAGELELLVLRDQILLRRRQLYLAFLTALDGVADRGQVGLGYCGHGVRRRVLRRRRRDVDIDRLRGGKLRR